jgi:hypothetical protein
MFLLASENDEDKTTDDGYGIYEFLDNTFLTY